MKNSPDNAEWRRKHDDPFPAQAAVPSPYAHFYPNSKQDLIDIIKCSLDPQNCHLNIPQGGGPPGDSSLGSVARRPVGPIRAVGSSFALSDVAKTEGWIVETDSLQKTLYDVIPSRLSHEAYSQLVGQKPEDDYAFNYYHVEAGIKIFELYSRLDRQKTEYQHQQQQPNDMPTDRDHHTSGVSALAGAHWAMPTLGGAGGQSIVGAFSTGTHGADHELPPIADAVQAIHLIGSDGNEYWIERVYGPTDVSRANAPPPFPLTEDAKLLALPAYHHVKIIRDQSIFNSVLVSAGRMGIIYSVVLRVTKQYGLHQWRWKDKWSSVKKWLGDPAAIAWDPPNQFQSQPPNPPLKPPPHRYLVVAINPNPMPDASKLPDGSADHTCYIEIHDTVVSTDLAALSPTNRVYNWKNLPPTWVGRSQRAGLNAGNSPPASTSASSAFLSWMCNQPNLAAVVNEIRASYLAAQGAVPIISGIAHALGGAIVPGAAETLDGILGIADATLGIIIDTLAPLVGQPIKLYYLLEAVMNASLDTPIKAGLVGQLNELLFGLLYGPSENTDISYAILDGLNYTDRQCSGGADSLTVSFPAPSPNAPDAKIPGFLMFLDTLFSRVTQLENGSMPLPDGTQTDHLMAFAGYISVRFTRASSATIAMQQWPLTCNIEIAGPKDIEGTPQLLSMLEADAAGMGATIHWGQRNDEPVSRIEAAFPTKLDEWRGALALFTANGRLTNFSTPFSRARGLEVVQPKITSFNVQRAHPSVVSGRGPLNQAEVTWDAADNPPGTSLVLQVGAKSYPSLPLKGNIWVRFGTHDIFSLVAAYTADDGITRTDTRS